MAEEGEALTPYQQAEKGAHDARDRLNRAQQAEKGAHDARDRLNRALEMLARFDVEAIPLRSRVKREGRYFWSLTLSFPGEEAE
jgi:hypothetical protein